MFHIQRGHILRIGIADLDLYAAPGSEFWNDEIVEDLFVDFLWDVAV